jgi:DNA replication protein DnaC
MLTTATLNKLKALKLYGMVKACDEHIKSSDNNSLTFEEGLEFLVEREIRERDSRRLMFRLKQAKLRHQARLEDIDYNHLRDLDKSLIKSLSTCQWIKDHLNLLVIGPCGVGKSFIVCALAHKACLEGYKVLYTRAPRLFQEFAVARGDGRYSKFINTIAKVNLLVIDDWGFSPLTDQERMDFLEILEDRHGIHSTIITSQLPIEHWHKMIGNPTLADAILDRVVHNAYKIDLKGGSMRKKQAKSA